MSKIFSFQLFRISFYKYRLNFNHFKQFESLFCDWLGFRRTNEIAFQTYIYSNRSAYYIIQVTDETLYPIMDGIGIHLKKTKIPKKSLLDSLYIGLTDIDPKIYVENLLKKSPTANLLTNNYLQIPGVKISDIQFYFTVSEDFRQGGIFDNSKVFSCNNYLDNLKYKKFKKVNLRNNFLLYHHHAAFYRTPQQIESLEIFFKEVLNLQVQNSYPIPDAQQHVTAFKINQLCLNTIKPINFNPTSSTLELEDIYSHGALGTSNIINFAHTIKIASHFPQNKVKIIQLGGNYSKLHHKATRQMYCHLLDSRQLSKLEKYQIHFETDLTRPSNRSFQFFFRSALGTIEGIQTEGKFSFVPRAGDGVTKGLNINSQAHKNV